MNIHFFEEFPNNKNFAKAKLLKSYSVIFIAADSYKVFLHHEAKLKRISPLMEAAYWPILKTSYWVSPFSDTLELQKLYSELLEIKEHTKILIDLELPMLHPSLFLKNFSSLKKNKTILLNILNLKGNVEIYTAEYPPFSMLRHVMKLLNLSNGHKNKIPMCYTSVLPSPFKAFARNTKSDWIGVGTIAKGIVGNEPILSPEELDHDLGSFEKLGTNNVVIFRLGGLNNKYMEVINNYNENPSD